MRALHTTDLDGMSAEERDRHVQQMLRALGDDHHAPTLDPQRPAPAPAATGADILPASLIRAPPFTNMSGDPGQDYFSDGSPEDIITKLSRWRRLFRVRSRSALFRDRGLALDMKQVARDLDVRFIVEGSVRRVGDCIRINAQLIEAESGSHVWAEKIDHGLDEYLPFRIGSCRPSSACCRPGAGPPTRNAPDAATSSLAAYECVLQGNVLPWDEPRGRRKPPGCLRRR